jgi:glutaconate CoA-transferase subunit A
VNRATTLEDALGAVRDGMVVAVGGSVLSRKPVAAVKELARSGARDLELVTFTGSLDVELLVRAGTLRAVRSSHVSLGSVGRAPAFTDAVERGTLEDIEESEWMLLGRLRAAAAGLPFVPTRAAFGSDLLEGAALSEVTDPYTGERFLALPPLRPDVALLHAWRADPAGNVQRPWPPDHLWDVDVLMARAADNVIVTTDNLVSEAEVAASSEATVLFGFEVDAVVETERGAFPTGSPPDYGPDLGRVASDAADNIAMIATTGAGRRRIGEGQSP